MSNQWRRLQFFERVVLQDLETNENLNIFKDFKPTCSSSGYGYIAFGGANGAVRFMNRQHKVVEFQAYGKTVLGIKQLKRSNIIVTVGEDSNTDNDTTLKFWRVSESNTSESLPVCVKTVRLFGYGAAKTSATVTCLAVLEDLSQVSVGFDDGTVLLVVATNIMRDRTSNITTVQAATGIPITNLVYRDDNKLVMLYIITATSTSLAYINKRVSCINVIDDNMGCAPNCAMVAENDTKHLYVCGSTIYTLERDDRLSCYVNSGNVTNATLFHDYLVLVHAEEDVGAVASGLTITPKHTITVYDLKAKLIVFSLRLEPIFCCLTEWQSLLVVLQNGTIVCLTDVPLSSKIAILFKRNLYNIAQSLANSYGTDPQVTAGITSHYADHLYIRGDYEGAMMQYIDTIGYIEPSHVIRKFLDAQRIANLTVYLEQLHTKGYATADHTTLLLTCYTKLRYGDKLNKFVAQKSLFASAGGVVYDASYIRHLQRVHEVALPKSTMFLHSPYYSRNDAKHSSSSASTTTSGSGAGAAKGGYDIISAIHSYRDCAYLQHALFLSLMFGVHHNYISLLIESGKHKEALNYINSLPKHLAYFYALRHGSVLLPHDRAGVTHLCIRLCTGTYVQNDTLHTVTLTPASQNAIVTGNTSGYTNSSSGSGGYGYGTYADVATTSAPSVTVSIDSKGAVHVIAGIDGDGEPIVPNTGKQSSSSTTGADSTATTAAAGGAGAGVGGSLTSSLASAMEAFSLTRNTNTTSTTANTATTAAANTTAGSTAATNTTKDKDKDKDVDTLTLDDFADTPSTPSSLRAQSLASQQDPMQAILTNARIAPHALFPIFSSDQPCFTVFLEALAAHDVTTGIIQTMGGNSVDIPEEHRVDPKHVWNALLEVYLQATTQGISTSKSGKTSSGKTQFSQLLDSEFLSDVPLDGMDTTEAAPVIPPYTYQSPEILFGSAAADMRADAMMNMEMDMGASMGMGMSSDTEHSLDSDASFPASAADHGHKVLYLLKHYTSKLDVHHAVLLLEASGFHRGLECLHVTMNSSQELLVLAMGTGNNKAVVEACRTYGNQDHSLWVSALVHFASLDPASDPHITTYLQECLEQVHKVGALSAINALQLIAANPDATLESVRGFLVRLLSKQTKQIEDDRAELHKYRTDMEAMRGELNDLSTKATIFKDVECHRCRAPLTLPTIHFMCLHSFHAQCAAEIDTNTSMGMGADAYLNKNTVHDTESHTDKECPICCIEYRKVQQIKASLRDSINHHDQFITKLDETTDGFDVVADYFGRGAFDTQ